jgi:type I restriction enzyme R subunit
MLAEWKGITKPLAEAYDANLRDYRDTIPRLFDANGFVILSNGLEAVMGASHAPLRSSRPGSAWRRAGGERRPGELLRSHLRAAPLPRPDRELHPVRGGP